LLIAFKNIR